MLTRTNCIDGTDRTSATVDGGAAVTYCYDANDKLTSTSDTRYPTLAYDARGNTVALGAEAVVAVVRYSVVKVTAQRKSGDKWKCERRCQLVTVEGARGAGYVNGIGFGKTKEEATKNCQVHANAQAAALNDANPKKPRLRARHCSNKVTCQKIG